MNEFTKQLFARIYLDKVTSEDFVDWAIDCLEEGLDTKNLRMLAASEKPYYSDEIETRFNKILVELDWQKPTKEESLFSFAKEFAVKIVGGNISPIQGSHEIYQISLELNYPPKLKAWLYLNEGHDPVTMEWLWDTYNYSKMDKEKWIEVIKREAKKLTETVFEEQLER